MSLLKSVFILICLQSSFALADAMTVIGGNDKARECYTNAMLSGELGQSSRLEEPCTYALVNVSLSRKDRAATHTNRGIIRNDNLDFEGALADFAIALEIREDAAEIYINRGNSYFMQEDYQAAISDYNRALELDIVQKHVVFLNRGLGHEAMNNLVDAEEDYRQALTYAPQWALAEGFLSRVLARQAQVRQPGQ